MNKLETILSDIQKYKNTNFKFFIEFLHKNYNILVF